MKLLVAPLLLVAACGGKKTESTEASCKDVEATMRRLEPERTKDLRPGLFEKLCKEKPEEFPAKRRGCIVKATDARDLKACADGAAEPPPRAPASAPTAAIEADTVKAVKMFGVEVDAPKDAVVEENDTNAHIGNGRFKLNLFVVDKYSQASAAANKASLTKEPGFVKFTTETDDGASWRFDYELVDGTAGTSSRIVVGKRSLDCGVHKVEPAVAAVVATSCANARPIGGEKPAATDTKPEETTPAETQAAETKSAGTNPAGASKATSGARTATSDSVASAPGKMDKAVIGREVKRNIAKIRYCYEKELARTPDLAGTVTVSFVIGADGRVTSSRASGMGNTAVESCAAALIQRIQFPKPEKAPVAVNYPFTFRPS